MKNKRRIIQTRIEGFEIRHAIEEDVQIILGLIKELAVYEKLLHEVVTTEEDLKKNLFGKKRYAETILGYYLDEPVSFALFFHNFSTFVGKPGLYLEDLYVKPEKRGKGFGKVLLAYLAKLAVERDCGRYEWAVLDWNEPALKFYKSLGATVMNEWLIHRVTGEALKKLAEQF
ncbi:MAG: GNAT family acetyltransferase [Bacteroides sp. SM23_62_1]|nr:MAG: GNAT family acetyltransferase [Bacteroides sp. SM23_62_1]